MIELAYMAQLMDNDVVRKIVWKQGDAIVKIKIPSSRTAAPTGGLIAYGDFGVCEVVELIKVDKTGGDEGEGGFLVGKVKRVRLPGA